MGQQIHYEIYCRRGAKGSWKLTEVKYDRDEAIKYAKTAMAEGTTGVKVQKETFNEETGEYLMLKIFEDGFNKIKEEPVLDEVGDTTPCFKPDDLYSYHARQTIERLIPDFLARHKVTVTELSHRADLLEKLEATGTLLQHAIQKVAVAQASSTSKPVQQIVKRLRELTTMAFKRVFDDTKKGVFPTVEAGQFGELAGKLDGQPNALYVLNGAIARHLSDASGWDDKVYRLIAMMKEADQSAGGALLVSAVDTLLAEMLSGPAALHELIGAQDNFGVALMNLVQLFLGSEPADGQRQGLISLTKRFKDDLLPEARTAIAKRLIAEFNSPRRLCPKSLIDEFKTLRQIANRVVLGVGKYLSHEDLVAAFTQRSKRLINPVTLGEYLSDAALPDEKFERLMFVEENIIGAENKRQLSTFVMTFLASKSLEAQYLSSKAPPLQRLQRLAELNSRIRRSGFQENQRAEIADALDRIACLIENQHKLFQAIDAKTPNHVEKAITVLRLFAAESFTEPRLATKAREMLAGYLAKPGFLAGYMAHTVRPEDSDADAAVVDLKHTLEKIGLTEETGLGSIAA